MDSLEGEGRVCTDAKLGKIATKKGLGSSVLANTMIFRRVLAALSSVKEPAGQDGRSEI